MCRFLAYSSCLKVRKLLKITSLLLTDEKIVKQGSVLPQSLQNFLTRHTTELKISYYFNTYLSLLETGFPGLDNPSHTTKPTLQQKGGRPEGYNYWKEIKLAIDKIGYQNLQISTDKASYSFWKIIKWSIFYRKWNAAHPHRHFMKYPWGFQSII